MATLTIHRIPALKDNYLWLAVEPTAGAVAVVDPAEAEPVRAKLKELGIDVNFRSWFGFFAPTGTPKDVVSRLNSEVARLINDPAFKAKFLASQGLETDFPTGASPEEFAKFMMEEREDFMRLAKVAELQSQ